MRRTRFEFTPIVINVNVISRIVAVQKNKYYEQNGCVRSVPNRFSIVIDSVPNKFSIVIDSLREKCYGSSVRPRGFFLLLKFPRMPTTLSKVTSSLCSITDPDIDCRAGEGASNNKNTDENTSIERLFIDHWLFRWKTKCRWLKWTQFQ